MTPDISAESKKTDSCDSDEELNNAASYLIRYNEAFFSLFSPLPIVSSCLFLGKLPRELEMYDD